jgi:WD40 repeat protein
VTTLRLLSADGTSPGHQGEVFACAYTPDGARVLSAGWDGYLRLWDSALGSQAAEVQASAKPLSSCAIAPDGSRWVVGSMDGLLAHWDAPTQQQQSIFLAHTRPISAIVHAPDGQSLATASWDRHLILWYPKPHREREHRTLEGHADIVAGCCFTPDGKTLLSWGHDRTVRLWDVARARALAVWEGHADRVTAGALSPEGRWFVSGGRDRLLKLWDVEAGREAHQLCLESEVRACFFLLDGQALVAVDAAGRLTVHAAPTLEPQSELLTQAPVQCAQLAPSGGQIVLGCDNGQLAFVAVDGFDSAPLNVTVTRANRTHASLLGRLFGKTQQTSVFVFTCPACRRSFELPATASAHAAPCPSCRRRLRVCAVTQA